MSAAAPARTSPTVAGWREELRRDRLVRAQIEQEREAARAGLRITERQAAARARHEHAQPRAVAQRQARREGAARRAARAAWVRGHVVDLLFVPVIVVPGLLSWTAMAAYGLAAYGSPGLALPALSEGAMWAFAGATTITRRRHPDRPVWHLRLGTLVFAAYGAALNFAHGLAPAVPGHGPVIGTVYALVSVAGVTAHQLVTAGPRRSRAERHRARIARAAARRELAARRAAVKNAVAELDGHGNARLVYQPGAAIAARRVRTRPLSAGDRPPVLLPAGPACPWPRPAPVLPAAPRDTAPAPGRTRTRTRRPGAPRPASAPRTRPVTGESAEVHFAAELAAGHVPSARRIKAELHVGQNRATQIHHYLTAIAAAPAAAT